MIRECGKGHNQGEFGGSDDLSCGSFNYSYFFLQFKCKDFHTNNIFIPSIFKPGAEEFVTSFVVVEFSSLKTNKPSQFITKDYMQFSSTLT